MQKHSENPLKVWGGSLKSKVEIVLDVSCFNPSDDILHFAH
jgi:hypothetical protein